MENQSGILELKLFRDKLIGVNTINCVNIPIKLLINHWNLSWYRVLN